MTNTNEEVKAAKTNKEYIAKLVPIFDEINTLNDDAKEILSEAKEAGLDAAMLSKVAKAISASKVCDLEEKTQELLNLLKEVA